MNGGGGGVVPVATASQLHRLNAAVALLQVGINDINFGVGMIQALNDVNHVDRLAVVQNGIGQINDSLGVMRAIMGRVVVGHNDLIFILVRAELISGSLAEIYRAIAQIGLADVVAGQPLGPSLAGRLYIHTGLAHAQAALAAVIPIIHPPVAPPALGPPNGGGVV